MSLRNGYASYAFPVVLVLAGSFVLPQGSDKKPPAGQDKKGGGDGAMEMPMPTAGPEHKWLMKAVGTWDATMKMSAPGAPATEGKGTYVVSACGPFWQVQDFKMADFMGSPFAGHGVLGYDPAKKKYVGTWVDSMTTELLVFDGTYDEAKKTMTQMTSMADPMNPGQRVGMRMSTEYKDDNTMLFSMFESRGGKETLGFTIEYKRKK